MYVTHTTVALVDTSPCIEEILDHLLLHCRANTLHRLHIITVIGAGICEIWCSSEWHCSVLGVTIICATCFTIFHVSTEKILWCVDLMEFQIHLRNAKVIMLQSECSLAF